jgi:hypothetical protein
MSRSNWPICMMMFILIPWTASSADKSIAQENKITVDELVAAHIKSIGSPEVLKNTLARAVSGSVSVEFLQGMYGTWKNGRFILASEPDKVGLRMSFGVINYPGEYFAYDGQDATIAHVNPGDRSLLGDFLFRHERILKDGFLGGVLSVNWPLLNANERNAWILSGKEKLNGRPVYILEYQPTKKFDTKIKLFFDAENYHHLQTEYSVRDQYDFTALTRTQAAYQIESIDNGNGNPSTLRITPNGYSVFTGNIMSSPPDSIYSLVEKFDDFKQVGGMTLPNSYKIEYTAEGQGSSFVGNWIMKIDPKVANNTRVEKDFYKGEK